MWESKNMEWLQDLGLGGGGGGGWVGGGCGGVWVGGS